MKAALFAILCSASIAQAQLSYGGVGGVDMGGGMRYGGIGGVSMDGHDPYNPYGPTQAEKRRQEEDDERRRRENDEQASRRREQDRRDEDLRARERAIEVREAADKYRLAFSTLTEVPKSWNGSYVAEEIEVSSAATGQALVYRFSSGGEILACGFAVVPKKTKAEWLHVQWGQAQDGGFAHCYARFAVGGKLAFGGLPVHPDICESVLPSQFAIEKSSDGKFRCFESSVDGYALRNGAPVDLNYCDQTKPFGTRFAAVIGVGSKGKSYVNDMYAAPMKACLKSSFGRPIQPTVMVPAEKCPGLSLDKAVFKQVRFAATPETVRYVKLVGAPISRTYCTLVDTSSNLPIAMQFDETKCTSASGK